MQMQTARRPTRQRHLLLLLLALLSGLCALLWMEALEPPSDAGAVVSLSPPLLLAKPRNTAINGSAREKPLNLQLPEEVLRAHPEINFQEPPSMIKPLFMPSEKQTVVSVGGGLILEEDPAPETPLKEQVKGARIDLEIKVP